MTIASFSFFIRTPSGKTPVTSDILQQPLLGNTGDKHPALTMADYFESLQQLVLAHGDSLLLPESPGNPSPPVHCLISSEKLGAFYHVARIELQTDQKEISLAVNTAISDAGRQCLATDHRLLGSRLPSAMRRFVPEILLYCGSDDENKPAAFHHLAVEWLEDFHEWHLCGTEQSNPRIALWTDKGAYPLGERESRALLRQIAHIITLSYDWDSGAFLQQWHHAAGDFIVRCGNHALDVRLITVRAIKPFPFLTGHDTGAKFSSLLLFLLDLSIRMRLDKLDGVGKTVWLDDFVVEETVRGFFSGLAEHRSRMGEAYETFLHLLPHFSPDDLRQLSTPLFSFYEEQLSPTDFIEAKSNFTNHTTYLAACLTDQIQGKPENPPLPGEPS